MQILKDDIQTAILNAAKEEFYSIGYRNSSMRTIAHKSNITAGNLYRYFRNKECILDELVSPVYTKILKDSRDLPEQLFVSDKNSADSFINLQLTYIMDMYRKYRCEIIILFKKSSGTKYSDFTQNVVKNLTQYIIKSETLAPLNHLGAAGAAVSSWIEGVLYIIENTEDPSTAGKALKIFFQQHVYGYLAISEP